jgi:metal-responsive CopG/Arc/MetJ family transcriptional regulator
MLMPVGANSFWSYTLGMKTAISIPEKVFREAERFARRVRKTRSRLYTEAVAEYLARHAPDDVTESMNQVCDRIGVSDDKFRDRAVRNVLVETEW